MQPELSFEYDTFFRNGKLGIIHEEHKEERDFLLWEHAQDVYIFWFLFYFDASALYAL